VLTIWDRVVEYRAGGTGASGIELVAGADAQPVTAAVTTAAIITIPAMRTIASLRGERVAMSVLGQQDECRIRSRRARLRSPCRIARFVAPSSSPVISR